MPSPNNSDAIDYGTSHKLSQKLLQRASCPDGVPFVVVRDADKKGLRLRVTKAGGKHWLFEVRVNGKLFSRALGEWPAVSIAEAQGEAHRLRGLTEKGTDPREAEREQQAAEAAKLAVEAAQVVTVGDVWPLYLQHGRPKRRAAWKPRYRADLEAMAAPGGEPKKRGKGTTRPGPLFPLLALRLVDVNEDTLKSWYDLEAKAGAHQATRALMMFRGFLRWCAGRPEFRHIVDRDAGRAAAIVESLPESTSRTDALEAAQVTGWWTGTEQLSNRTASVYLRALLLTGARREELAALKWTDVDFQWRKLTIADKVDATRTIPLTPYLAQMLTTLPRVNEFVFASSGKAGRIADVRASHAEVLSEAGVNHLTIHGLRRTFVQRGRAVVPAGAVAQIAGHKPSATAEGYAVLPMDDLRPFAEKIEAHILKLANVQFFPEAEPGKLKLVQ